jgi:hypothetical protein
MKHLAEPYTAQGQHAKAVEVLEKNLAVNDPWDLDTIETLAQERFNNFY